MIWADWFLLAALVVSILIGVMRGFTREVLGLISWIVAIAAAAADGTTARTFYFPGDREAIRRHSTAAALDMVRRRLL